MAGNTISSLRVTQVKTALPGKACFAETLLSDGGNIGYHDQGATMNTQTPLDILQQISADMAKRGVDFKLITQAIDPAKHYDLTPAEVEAYRTFLEDDGDMTDDPLPDSLSCVPCSTPVKREMFKMPQDHLHGANGNHAGMIFT